MCPGHHNSAGRRQSGRTRFGASLAHRRADRVREGRGRTKGTYLSARHAQLRRRRGRAKAIAATRHDILVARYHIVRDQVPTWNSDPTLRSATWSSTEPVAFGAKASAPCAKQERARSGLALGRSDGGRAVQHAVRRIQAGRSWPHSDLLASREPKANLLSTFSGWMSRAESPSDAGQAARTRCVRGREP
jgi:hypothetical protein